MIWPILVQLMDFFFFFSLTCVFFFKLIMLDNFASVFNCTTVSWTSNLNWITAPSQSLSDGGSWLLHFMIWPIMVQPVAFFYSGFRLSLSPLFWFIAVLGLFVFTEMFHYWDRQCPYVDKGAISLLFHNIFSTCISLTKGVKLHIYLLNVVVRFIFFLSYAILICRGTDT